MERVELHGIDKDGNEIVLGTLNETPAMYARGLITGWFGPFKNEDGSDADWVYQMVKVVLNYAYKYEPDYDMKETV